MKLFRSLLILSLTIGLLSLASATTVIPMSVEKLVSTSSHVVEATAIQAWSEWNPQHTIIFTFTKFQVTRDLKGQIPATIIVKQLGGSAGGYTQRVAGVRHWRSGEQAVLFLRPSQDQDGTLEVTGLMQGNFMVRQSPSGESLVSNGVPEVSAYQIGSRDVAPFRGSGMRLEELESRVQKAVQ
jgi:hypothetical protein